ncbi:N-acetylglucosaminyl-diphospho-decaprenol L-rhamnosyltransferase [Polaribacter huanghezhanensis]|uniref:glycosyltransferase family 2 protein n=1 Tax=Polaribacter huanghezhanensis TaxID=1354726 RepID=UPI00264A2127|nr:glycosyltransferase family 2 protein [Polaribacter huanghezhanensis]WKD85558.1 N-acetylglucosaminyl-diphospho-decaprenol L-rhamnosyltransferase [Polaribacter huanghezhanensis]
MSDNIEISATIVVYNEDVETLQKTVDCFLKTPLPKKLYLVDNSPTDVLKEHFKQEEIVYLFTRKNLGFGKAHNLVISKLKSEFHLILNPDVTFSPQVLPNLIHELNHQGTVAMISPQVLYPNGELQYTCRKKPTFLELICRRLRIKKEFTQQQEYRNLDLSKPFYPEFIHGCFMVFKTQDFKNINGFDERYFLYLEDADICRKVILNQKKILYFPSEKITHLHQKASAKRLKLFYHHIISAIKYTKKWQF